MTKKIYSYLSWRMNNILNENDEAVVRLLAQEISNRFGIKLPKAYMHVYEVLRRRGNTIIK